VAPRGCLQSDLDLCPALRRCDLRGNSPGWLKHRVARLSLSRAAAHIAICGPRIASPPANKHSSRQGCRPELLLTSLLRSFDAPLEVIWRRSPTWASRSSASLTAQGRECGHRSLSVFDWLQFALIGCCVGYPRRARSSRGTLAFSARHTEHDRPCSGLPPSRKLAATR